MLNLFALLSLLASGPLVPEQEENQPPQTVKTDIFEALAVIKQEFRGEDQIFVRKLELRKATGAEKRFNKNLTWVWDANLKTHHANHWGPARLLIDAQSGKALSTGSHRHKGKE